ncbi:tetratricopeptide repeat protein [Gimesia chilikensis]|uniref:Sel1 repeat protein n=1 Tax=Gimesia chilikensis TaxID=2605989 RepID=A0A517PSY1_9PLAN|nr:SEL1-like repeat protein [Gimesia chilikensis]QDT22485.1 Sel1 repeat protein [Gimesia chilikensis]
MTKSTIAEINELADAYYFQGSKDEMSIYDWIDANYSLRHKSWRQLAETGYSGYYWLLGIACQTQAPWKYKAPENPVIYVPPLASEANAASKSLFRLEAESGCQYSQYEHASVFLRRKNCSSAFRWYLASANQGFSPAMHAVGIFYLNSWSVAADYDQAYCWVSRAAEKGLSHSQLTLALFYRDGIGVPRDIEEARKRLQCLSSSGHFEAGLYLRKLEN